MSENNDNSKIKRIFNVDESVYAQVGANINNDAEMDTTVSDILQNNGIEPNQAEPINTVEPITIQNNDEIVSDSNSSIFGVPLNMDAFDTNEVDVMPINEIDANQTFGVGDTFTDENNTSINNDVLETPINSEIVDLNNGVEEIPSEEIIQDMSTDIPEMDFDNSISTETTTVPVDVTIPVDNLEIPSVDVTPVDNLEMPNVDVAPVEPVISPMVEDIFPSVESVNNTETTPTDIAPEIADALNSQDNYTLEATPQELVVNYQEEDNGDLASAFNRDTIVNNYNDTHLDNTTSEEGYFNSVDDILENSEDINFYQQQPKATMDNNVSSMTIPVIPTEPSPMPQEVPTYTPEPDRFGFNAASTYDDHNDFFQTNSSYDNQTSSSSPYVVDNTPMSSYEPPKERNTYIPKSEFASRPNMGETNFDKKMRRQTRPINFVLFALYAVCFAIIIFVGYNIYLNSTNYYASRSNMKLVLGSSYQESLYKKGILQNNEDFIWESTNPEIATVDSNGNISSASIGNAVITFKNKKTKQGDIINVNVVSLTIEKFTTDVDKQIVYMGNTYTITPLINDQNSYTIDLVWESTNPDVAEVDKDGIVTPKSKGETQIIISVPDTEFMTTVDITVMDTK